MTQPIQEPSDSRKFSKLTYGQDQLQRRPAPVSAAGVWGVPDLILSGGAATIPTDTEFPIPWQVYATPHATDGTFEPITISDDAGDLLQLTITDTGDPGNDRWEVQSLRRGWWANELITNWDQVGTPGAAGREIASVRQRLTWTSVTGFSFSPTEFMDDDDWMIQDSYDGGALVIDSFGFLDNSYLRTWMAPHFIPINKTWVATGIQRTGTDRGLSGIKWAWWFIEEDDIATWTEGTV